MCDRSMTSKTSGAETIHDIGEPYVVEQSSYLPLYLTKNYLDYSCICKGNCKPERKSIKFKMDALLDNF